MTNMASQQNAAGMVEGQPFVWNLVFPNGSTQPHLAIAEILEEDAETPITSVIPQNLDFNSWDVQPLSPGIFLPASIAAAIRFGIMEQFGALDVSTGASDILLGIYGYHPIPNPAAYPDWGTEECVYAGGHPVYWLPPEVRDINFWADERFAPHRESLEQIRLAMELAYRGAYNIETGDFLDVLVTQGIDGRLMHEELKEAFELSKRGIHSDLFESLKLPSPEDENDYGEAAARFIPALIALEMVRSNFDDFKPLIVDNLNERSMMAMGSFRSIEHPEGTDGYYSVNVPGMMNALEVASRELLQSQFTEADFTAFEEIALGRVQAIGDVLYESYFPMHAMLVRRKYNFIVPAEVSAEGNARQEALHEENDRLLKKVNDLCVELRIGGAAIASEKLTEIWNLVGAEMTNVVNMTAAVWEETDALGPIKDEDYTVPAPPMLAIPAEAQPGVERWYAERVAEFSPEISDF